MYELRVRLGKGKPGTTKTGQKDTSGVVLGQGTSFFFLCVFYILTNDFYLFRLSVLKVQGRLEWAATTKTGPNDASGVVWALGAFFFLRFFNTN